MWTISGYGLDNKFAYVACRCIVVLGFSMVDMETRGIMKIGFYFLGSNLGFQNWRVSVIARFFILI